RIGGFEGAAPLALSTRSLTPNEPIELLAGAAFVLSIERAADLDLRAQDEPVDRIGGRGAGDRVPGSDLSWVAGSDLSARCSGQVRGHRHRDPQSAHGIHALRLRPGIPMQAYPDSTLTDRDTTVREQRNPRSPTRRKFVPTTCFESVIPIPL